MIMEIAEIEELTADVKKVASQSKATGPRTEKGKLRAALNATKHGLSGIQMLLPGEDPVVYGCRADAVFTALGIDSDAEAQLGALIADDLWKLERLAKIEHGLTLGRIEELLGLTQSAEKAASTTTAIAALGSAITSWELPPIPTERTPDYVCRFRALSDAIDLVSASVPELPREVVEECDHLVAQLLGKRGDTTVPLDAYARLDQAVCMLMAKLLEHGDRIEMDQETMRKAIATIALPNMVELAKLSKYRRMLEDSLQRRLHAFEQLRALAAARQPTDVDREMAKEYRVRLRLVG
jgi:hypothetical protein